MTARTAERRRTRYPAEADDADDVDDMDHGDGLMGRLVDRVLENPAMSGGLVVMALTAAAVISNAVFLQRAHHPEPWFMTRPAPVATAPGNPDVAVPDPRPRAQFVAPTPTERPAVAASASPPPARATAAPEPKLIASLQKALSERGFYKGRIDGISGSRTRAAITAYQQSAGLPVTGEATASVLDHINTASVAPAVQPAKPVPPVAKAVAAAESPPTVPASPAKTVAVEPAPAPAPLATYPPPAPQVAAAPVPVTVVDQAAPTPVSLAPTSSGSAQPAPSASQRYRSVERALNLIGYGPVPEDGVKGDAITDAIRRFELDHGLPITGTPTDGVMNRLIEIGAMDAT